MIVLIGKIVLSFLLFFLVYYFLFNPETKFIKKRESFKRFKD